MFRIPPRAPMEIAGFCQKENCEVPISRGCLYPRDYCPHRQACLIHFMERERSRSAARGNESPGKEGEEDDADPDHE